jgi:hypothetical protein
MVHQGPMHVCLPLHCKQHASHSLPACGRAGRLPLAWPSPSRTYASCPPAPALQAAYFPQSVGLSEGRSSYGYAWGVSIHIHPLPPPTFSSCTTGPTVGPRVCDEKLHPIPMSLAPGKDENFWVLGRGPHAAIEMRKENPCRNDTGREGEVLVQPTPTLTETGSKVEFQHQ